MKRFVAVTAILLLTAPVFAQTAAKPPAAAPKPATAANAAAPKPAPEMERINKLFGGRWNTAEKFDPSEMMPQGGEGNGTESFRPGPGGFSMISEYSSVGPMGQYTGHGIIFWAAPEHAYHFYWFDSAKPEFSTLICTWVGDNLVAVGTENVLGKKMITRHTFSEIKSDSFVYTIEMGPTSSSLKRVMTINYSKANPEDMWRRKMSGILPPKP